MNSLEISKKLKTIIKIGLYSTLLTPLIVFRSVIYPFFFSKAIFFQIIVEILTILWLIYLLFGYRAQENKFKWKTPLFWTLLAFVVVNFLAAVFGVNFTQSFWSNFERMDGLFFLIHLFVYFLLLRSFFEEKDWKIFWQVFLGISLIVGIISLLSPGETVGRIAGIFGNPIYLGAFFTFSTFIGAWFFFCEKRKIWRMFFGVATIFYFILVVLSGSRGPFIGVIIGLLGLSFLAIFILKPSKRIKTAMELSFLILILLGGTAYGFRSSPLLERTALGRVIDLKIDQARIITWEISLSAWRAKPILGWGQENFEAAFSQHFKPELFRYEQSWFDKPHNKYLEILTGSGILGLLAYLSIIGTLVFYLKSLFRKRKTVTVFFSGLVIAYLFQNIFAFDTPATYLIFFSVISFLDFEYQVIGKPKVQEQKLKTKDLSVAEKSFCIILIVLLCASLYQYNWKAIKSSRLFEVTLNLPAQTQISGKEIIKTYQEILNIFPQNSHQFRLLMTERIANLAIEGDARFQDEEVLASLDVELKKNLTDYPLSIKSYFGLAKVYQLLGVTTGDAKYTNLAKKTLLDGLDKFPKRVDFYRELAQTENLLGNEKEAKDYCEKAYPLKC
ncbi:O-antigen ligase family protein [bacterium]|nr:MAG: O-antigen ligase family protein [bacterium]